MTVVVKERVAALACTEKTKAIAVPVPTANVPLGSAAGAQTNNFTAVPYVTDSHQRFLTRTNGLNEHNSETLRTARLAALMGYWQVEFDPPLQKDNTQIMDVTFGYSWARA